MSWLFSDASLGNTNGLSWGIMHLWKLHGPPFFICSAKVCGNKDMQVGLMPDCKQHWLVACKDKLPYFAEFRKYFPVFAPLSCGKRHLVIAEGCVWSSLGQGGENTEDGDVRIPRTSLWQYRGRSGVEMGGFYDVHCALLVFAQNFPFSLSGRLCVASWCREFSIQKYRNWPTGANFVPLVYIPQYLSKIL